MIWYPAWSYGKSHPVCMLGLTKVLGDDLIVSGGPELQFARRGGVSDPNGGNMHHRALNSRYRAREVQEPIAPRFQPDQLQCLRPDGGAGQDPSGDAAPEPLVHVLPRPQRLEPPAPLGLIDDPVVPGPTQLPQLIGDLLQLAFEPPLGTTGPSGVLDRLGLSPGPPST